VLDASDGVLALRRVYSGRRAAPKWQIDVMPAGGFTKGQIVALVDIGFDEADPEIKKQHQQVIDAVYDDTVLKSVLEYTGGDVDENLYARLRSKDGVPVYLPDDLRVPNKGVLEDGYLSVSNREGELVYSVQVSPDLAIALLGYAKYGGWNYALRFFERHDEAYGGSSYATATSAGVSPESLAALAAHFNR
jgi:hypothetical protein